MRPLHVPACPAATVCFDPVTTPPPFTSQLGASERGPPVHVGQSLETGLRPVFSHFLRLGLGDPSPAIGL